jgi:hypothetical protein
VRGVRRLILLAAVAWVGRWLLRELACRAGHKLLPPGPPPRESVRPPGWMPGTFER